MRLLTDLAALYMLGYEDERLVKVYLAKLQEAAQLQLVRRPTDDDVKFGKRIRIKMLELHDEVGRHVREA